MINTSPHSDMIRPINHVSLTLFKQNEIGQKSLISFFAQYFMTKSFIMLTYCYVTSFKMRLGH